MSCGVAFRVTSHDVDALLQAVLCEAVVAGSRGRAARAEALRKLQRKRCVEAEVLRRRADDHALGLCH
jgi:hypothetical protein